MWRLNACHEEKVFGHRRLKRNQSSYSADLNHGPGKCCGIGIVYFYSAVETAVFGPDRLFLNSRSGAALSAALSY